MALGAETALCLSLFGPQPLAWAAVVEELLPREAAPGWRLLLTLAATVASTAVTFRLARRIDEVRLDALKRIGHVPQHDVLTVLVVALAGALGAIAFVWFLFGGGYTP